MENDEFRIDLSGDPLDRIIAHAREVIEITEGLLERQRQHLRELEAARGGAVETKQEEARITMLSALDLVATWRMKWRQLVEDKVCEITDNEGWIVRSVLGFLSREVEVWNPNGGAVTWLAALDMTQLTVRWLDTPAESGQEEARLDDDGNIIDLNTLWLMYDDLYAEYMSSNQSGYEKKVNDVKAENARLQAELGTANERLEQENRDLRNNLRQLVNETGIEWKHGDERLDAIVINAFRSQIAEVARAALAKLDAKEEGE